MKQQNSLLYGVIGVLVGGALVWFLATNAVNGNSYGMMQMMGIKAQPGTTSTMMSANIDRHFIEQMIPHHQDAIAMAEIALQKTERPENKKLAQDIKRTQSEEITQMKSWYKSWYGSDVLEDSNETTSEGMMGQMHGGMMGDKTDTTTLENASNFDKAFIEEMIPHHQMAVMMANMLLQGTNREEMKQLAKNIIATQTKEINEMRQWYTDWGFAQ